VVDEWLIADFGLLIGGPMGTDFAFNPKATIRRALRTILQLAS
jgi:hypothetical protein